MAKVLTPERINETLSRIATGESIPSIAASFGVERSSLYRMLRRRKVGELAHCWSGTLNLPNEPATLGYIAGIIDGEGSIFWTNKVWQVAVKMTDRSHIEWLSGFGGRFSEEPSRSPHRKNAFMWRISRRKDILLLLHKILPYLKVKRMQAEEALRYCEEKNERG